MYASYFQSQWNHKSDRLGPRLPCCLHFPAVTDCLLLLSFVVRRKCFASRLSVNQKNVDRGSIVRKRDGFKSADSIDATYLEVCGLKSRKSPHQLPQWPHDDGLSCLFDWHHLSDSACRHSAIRSWTFLGSSSHSSSEKLWFTGWTQRCSKGIKYHGHTPHFSSLMEVHLWFQSAFVGWHELSVLPLLKAVWLSKGATIEHAWLLQ